MNEFICIIGSGKEVVDRAKSNGLNILLVQSHHLCPVEPQKFADFVFICNFELDDSVDQVVRLCRGKGISKVLTLSEHASFFSAKVNDKLNRTNIYYKQYRFFSDKLYMRRKLEGSTLNRVEFMGIKDNKELIKAIDKLGVPMILKPIYGVGSRNIHLIRSYEDAMNIPELNEEYIAEAFIIGTEYSLECFSKEGIHTLHAVTEKGLFDESPSMFVERNHLITKKNNNGNLYRELQLFIEQLLNQAEYKNGPSHIEVKVDGNNSISLIEAHSRVGGDSIPELVALATSVDLYNFSILSHMDYDFDNSRKKVERESAIVFFPLPAVGKVLKGIQQLYCNPYVKCIKEPNNNYPTSDVIRKSSDRNGYVIYCIKDNIKKLDMMRYIR